jgi:hypothetical protein
MDWRHYQITTYFRQNCCPPEFIEERFISHPEQAAGFDKPLDDSVVRAFAVSSCIRFFVGARRGYPSSRKTSLGRAWEVQHQSFSW